MDGGSIITCQVKEGLALQGSQRSMAECHDVFTWKLMPETISKAGPAGISSPRAARMRLPGMNMTRGLPLVPTFFVGCVIKEVVGPMLLFPRVQARHRLHFEVGGLVHVELSVLSQHRYDLGARQPPQPQPRRITTITRPQHPPLQQQRQQLHRQR